MQSSFLTDDVLVRSGGDVAEVDKGSYKEAMTRCGLWLAARPRAESELRDRLDRAGFGSDVIDLVLTRLKEMRLVDDADFAAMWIEERAARKGLSVQALADELAAKGIDSDTIEDAIAGAGLDDDARAIEWAARYFPRVAGQTTAEQVRRLTQMLARRGFSEDAVVAAVRKTLPPEGWD